VSILATLLLVGFGANAIQAQGKPNQGLQNQKVCKSDPKGCIVVMPHDPVSVGTLLDLTGPASTGGIIDTDAVLLALEEEGAIAGHALQRVSRSDGCDGSENSVAIAGAKDLAAANVLGIIGTTCSGAAKQAVTHVTGDLGITMFSPSNTNPSLTEADSHLPFYARAFNDNTQAIADANYAHDHLNVTKVAIVRDSTSLYSMGLAEAFEADVSSLGITVITIVDEDCSANNCNDPQTHASTVNTILAAGTPDLIFSPYNGAPDGVGLILAVRGHSELDQTRMMGGDSLDDNALASGGQDFTGAGTKAEGFLASGPPANPASFVNKYQQRFGTAPSAFSGIAYDEAKILIKAATSVMTKQGDMKGNSILLFPRTALYQALLATSGYEGVMGTYDCSDPNSNLGDCLSRVQITINEVQNGSFVQVFP